MDNLSSYIPSDDLTVHPAVRAWSKLQQRPAKPRSIEVLTRLHKRAKSCTFRLRRNDCVAPSVVAKLCLKEIAQVERLIYETILPELPIPGLEYYGTIASEDPKMEWLFVEDAGGVRYARDVEEHRKIAARWIAVLHTSAENLRGLKQLPDRGPSHYLAHLRSGRERIRASRTNPVLTRQQHAVLDRIETNLNLFESIWFEFERLCQAIPCTFVHGDLRGRNAHLRVSGKRREFIAFDWETAGRGVPVVDLATSRIYTCPCCLRTYFEHVREAWPALSLQDITQMASVGRIFRVVAGIDWASVDLSIERADCMISPISYMTRYLERIECELRAPVWRGHYTESQGHLRIHCDRSEALATGTSVEDCGN